MIGHREYLESIRQHLLNCEDIFECYNLITELIKDWEENLR